MTGSELDPTTTAVVLVTVITLFENVTETPPKTGLPVYDASVWGGLPTTTGVMVVVAKLPAAHATTSGDDGANCNVAGGVSGVPQVCTTGIDIDAWETPFDT